MSDPFRNISDPRFPSWEKSPLSGPSEGCLYVSAANDGSGDVGLSEDRYGPEGPVLVLSRNSWEKFYDGVKSGAFDHI